jgi:hypothetical protein
VNVADPTPGVADRVTVVGLDEPAPAPEQPARRPGRSGWLAALLLGGLVVLLLLPVDDPLTGQPLAEGEVPAPADERLLGWPGRGPWAADEAFVGEAAQAWREAATSDASIDAPGDEIVPLWAGPVSDAAMAVLQSVGADGSVRLAHVSDMLYGWLQPELRVLATTRVDAEPEFVVVPFVGPDDRGGQLDPDVLATFQMLPGPAVRNGEHRVVRLDGARLTPIEMQADGLSEPWAYGRWWIRDEPVIAFVTRGEDDALVSVVRHDPDEMLPGRPPVQLVDPIWGSDEAVAPADYVVAAAALEALGAPSGRAAVLGSAVTTAGRVTLLQVEPRGSTGASTVVALTARGDLMVSSPTPIASDAEVAIGALRTPDGQVVVVAAASPQTTMLRIEADGETLVNGPGVQAAVLERDAEVVVLRAQAVGASAGQSDTATATTNAPMKPAIIQPKVRE